MKLSRAPSVPLRNALGLHGEVELVAFGGTSVMASKEERGRPGSDISYCSRFTFHLSGKRIRVRLYSEERGLAQE